MKDLVVEILKSYPYSTSTELVETLEESYGLTYKRNSLSEACNKLVRTGKIKKRQRERDTQGRPEVEFFLLKEKET